MASKKPLILVTNDDGISASGLQALVAVMLEIGEVVVVAPDKPQSGMSQAITIHNPLFCVEKPTDSKAPYKAFSCSGTPADCVKIAHRELLDRKPDLCVSGINHGSNATINVVYSGTLGAAIEAGIGGIPAVGFSLLDHAEDADFGPSKKFVKEIAKRVLDKGLPKGVVLNVNIPKLAVNRIKGIKICRQATGYWKEHFEKRLSPVQKPYYWLDGEYISEDNGTDTDEWALQNGYVSIVPTLFDLTAYHELENLNNWSITND